MIKYIELSLGMKVDINRVPIPKADVFVTYANVSHAAKLLGYRPKTQLENGVKKFIKWYKTYIHLK